MKKMKLMALSLITAGVLFSCSNDDNGTVNDDTTDDVVNLRSELYASNNANGNVTQYNVADLSVEDSETYITISQDSEGIYYNPTDDELVQASRTLGQLNAYADISLADDGINLALNFSSTADLTSPRDIAVGGGVYVVADNSDVDGDPMTDDGRLFVYVKDGSGFTLRNTVTVDFAVWGIEFVNSDLYVVVDKTSDIAVFNNFATSYTTDETATPSKRVTVEGIVRTHGLAFDGDTMILTDVGDAGSDTDGAFHIITEFQSKIAGISDGGILVIAGNQVRVAGGSTFLGNPVAAEFDAETNTVYIAERANGGGRVLAFTDANAGGDIAPTANYELQGASSLYLYKE